MNSSLPSRQLLQLQADWLSDARSRLLRLAEIARRKRLLDLGAGYGIITEELKRRSSGSVIALDYSKEAIQSIESPVVCADVASLPFLDQAFDFTFSQNVLLWISKPERVISQVFRILTAGGVWVLFEPDYGAIIEFPEDTRSIWIDALTRAGADPYIGRRLPSLLELAGFRSRIEFLPRLMPCSNNRLDFLEDLPLTEREHSKMDRIRRFPEQQQISHLPYFLIIAERP